MLLFFTLHRVSFALSAYNHSNCKPSIEINSVFGTVLKRKIAHLLKVLSSSCGPA